MRWVEMADYQVTTGRTAEMEVGFQDGRGV